MSCLDCDGGAEAKEFDDSEWKELDLPHDWSIEGTFAENNAGGKRGGYVELGVGWYRKTFELSREHREKKIFVQFDGIYKDSDVWLNGPHLGKRWYGYVSFQYDLTPHINWDGPNVLAVRVNNGDLWSTASYKGDERKAHHGRCLVIVRSQAQPGRIQLTASADGLGRQKITLITQKALMFDK